ncbi:hypothetical protein [Herminiimonas contaminans]|uniref:Tail assembly chaperone n=1 Tax=Herminiimonas contaminans TaxID=1111140 RepID=A0ABS0EVI2_9BURK|nr:hypothetical protein [Herminiimonas contaminans]MBF8177842.1 hypothetical protein [Herminiimonas contaminans]
MTTIQTDQAVPATPKTEAWLIERYDANDKLVRSVVLAPLTDDVFLDESSEAIALCRVEDAAPQQAVAASSEPVKLTDWDRISKAAATACNEYGQWMPERWIQLFVAAYNKE